MKKILITGGAGYIGALTTKLFLDKGYEIDVLDNLSTGKRSSIDKRAGFIEGDVCDADLVHEVLKKGGYDAVVHFAALKSVEEGESDPERYERVNVEGTQNVLDAMAVARVPHIIFSSSAAVYGPVTGGLCTEESVVEPSSVYGRTKLKGEELIQQAVRDGRIQKGTILRYFNVAGDNGILKESKPVGLFPSVVKALADGSIMEIYGDDYNTPDGTCVRDYVHVRDIALAHIAAYEKSEGGVYNIGSGTGFSVKEVIDTFRNVYEKDIDVVYKPRRAGDVAYSCADISNALKDLQWQPTSTLAEMVESTRS